MKFEIRSLESRERMMSAATVRTISVSKTSSGLKSVSVVKTSAGVTSSSSAKVSTPSTSASVSNASASITAAVKSAALNVINNARATLHNSWSAASLVDNVSQMKFINAVDSALNAVRLRLLYW